MNAPDAAAATPDATPDLADVLPLRIERAEIEVVSLLLGGHAWSLGATCLWRWFDPRGRVVSNDTPTAPDDVWDLVGDSIVSVEWVGPPALGYDPRLRLASGGELALLSDGLFDTWVLHVPGRSFVGPWPPDVPRRAQPPN